MGKITTIILDLYNDGKSIKEIANFLLTFHKNEISVHNQSDLELSVSSTLRELEDEFEADAYLSSMDCYYENYGNF